MSLYVFFFVPFCLLQDAALCLLMFQWNPKGRHHKEIPPLCLSGKVRVQNDERCKQKTAIPAVALFPTFKNKCLSNAAKRIKNQTSFKKTFWRMVFDSCRRRELKKRNFQFKKKLNWLTFQTNISKMLEVLKWTSSKYLLNEEEIIWSFRWLQ